MPTWSRRRSETILLAGLAIASVIPLRYFVESRSWFLGEMVFLCISLVVAEIANAFMYRLGSAKKVATLATLCLCVAPVLFGLLARGFGAPIAFEMTALTVVGAVSLALAVSATTQRMRSMSLILSGFLVLFTSSISDSSYVAFIPIAWMLGCVWHLVANHWERIDVATPELMERTWSLRPGIMLLTLAVAVAGGYAIQDRFVLSRRLELGLMPTSGGSEWSDPAARSGVGAGDAAVAAKDHAESFGAVDSDIFLESTESSLFDMVNDMIGEPKKKNKWERRQAAGNENVIPMHERAAKSDKGGGSFSTERMPPKKHRHFRDAKDASVIQWDGPTGIRLAMHRYDTFDGKDWIQSANLRNEKLTQVDMESGPWFFDPLMRDVLDHSSNTTSVGLLKIIRLASPRLPVPMLTAGIHIKEIDRQDFFGIAEDGSFFMPGREKVPPLTVAHVASVGLTEDEILANLEVDHLVNQSEVGSELLDEYVSDWTKDSDTPYEKLQSIVDRLRSEFVFDRTGESGATSFVDFLRLRRGGDHLFASTAAMMVRRIGLSSRLVTGFYVRPDSFDLAAGHASVFPQDVHVWTEVRLADGRWFEIEPTPGYRQPSYQPSWHLLARRFAVANWASIIVGTVALAGLFLTRVVWIDWLLTLLWNVTSWLRPRQRVGLAIRIIEIRASLAGYRRPVGKSQRAWLEQLTATDAKLAAAVRRFADAADAIFFGAGDAQHRRFATELVGLLQVRTITHLISESV